MPFGDYDCILTVFSASEGLIKLVVKRAYGRKSGHGSITAPFTKAEFIYSKGRSELLTCSEISLLDHHLQLRNSWDALQAAGAVVKAILSTQQLHKPAPLLYELLLKYLSKIGISSHPETLAASFQLKLLHHEGLMHLSPKCSQCHTDITLQHISEGQSYCHQHAPSSITQQFTAEESDLLLLLTYGRSLSSLTDLPLSKPLQAKISDLFAINCP